MSDLASRQYFVKSYDPYLISGDWYIFNGNQLGNLLAAYLWRHHNLVYPEAPACKLQNSIICGLLSDLS
jgi:hypothetical protein